MQPKKRASIVCSLTFNGRAKHYLNIFPGNEKSFDEDRDSRAKTINAN
jgi:hypothetical protein